MLRRKGCFWLLLPFLISFFSPLFMPGNARAQSENPPVAGVPATGKVPAADAARLTAESGETAEKPPVPPKKVASPQKHLNAASNLSPDIGNGKRETEQDIMEKALELLNISQEFWVKGDFESALDVLDQAYAMLLETNGDTDILREKDDLRLLISKRILAIYTSKHTVTNGMRSPIPIVMNAEVEKEIRSFQTVERDFFLQAYQRSYFYRPVIVEALKKAGLPEELSWLPLVESGYKIRALSRARALGLWQFIPSTGYKYGLSRDEWIDERMDVEKSTQAAIGYLKDLHDMFGDWLTVLAAYNSGEWRVLRVISGQHLNYLDRFWDLYNQLPNETARYVPRFLATLHIINDPQKYGMNLDAQSENQPIYAYDVVATNRCMNLQDIASRIDAPEELLSVLNAELRYKKTPEKEYSLKVPPEAAEKLRSIMDEIPLAEKPQNADSRRIAMIRHKVKAGETLSSIAGRYNTTAGAIRKYNRALAKKGVRVGQKLMVPVRGAQAAKVSRGKISPEIENISRYRVKKGDTLSSLARRFEMTVSEIKQMNSIKGDTLKAGQSLKINRKTAADSGGQKPDRPKGGQTRAGKAGRTAEKNNEEPKTYIVKKGDNLNKIAQRNDSNIGKLQELNKLTDKGSLQPGQVIIVR